MQRSTDTTKPSVAIVVLAWNGWEVTRECLESLGRVTYEPLRVLLVDNGSTDGTASLAAAHFPWVEVIALGENRGYCGGNNAGIERALAAGADHVMLLNNDTTVDPGFLEPLVAALERDPGLGFVSPEIVYDSDPTRVWFAGGIVDWPRGWAPHVTDPAPQMRATATATGCCVLAPRAVWERVGGLDERYFLFWEDTDWSLRVTGRGYRGAVLPESSVRHKVSTSFQDGLLGLGCFYFVRNGVLFNRTHAPRPWLSAFRFALVHALAPSLREAKRRERGWPQLALVRATAIAAGVAGRNGRAPRYAAWLAGARAASR